MTRPRVLIISPAAASANNGNWHTAWRWSRMLRPAFDATIALGWNGEPFDVMLALHARRSAESIARWARSKGAAENAQGLGVVLTGTDLYRDIQSDTQAQASLQYARQLVVLQECGAEALPPALRHKARVIFQSAAAQEALPKPTTELRVLMAGHLRDEKSPRTLWDAARILQPHTDIFIDHIGEALEPALGAQARACMVACPQYRWLGGMAHDTTLQAIAQAHVLVHTSRMEGGAQVILEAVCSGTPVLASNIPGNVGMLGADYRGYFALGDATALADLLLRCRAELDHDNGFCAQLSRQCALRVPLFSPATEQAAVRDLVNDLLDANP
ncbi:selenoneine biosynthesis selenosugar synthase SenB [Rhodoferax sp.]|uniref:selenoneine biosynthesis selenosugar synthase SenB n=1 Tax=Rhodoferax sp. TaxID=50421 RepID=UPI0026152E4D|nr:selenoneine biosynthesis selenosugar synthase SenB [Rhodoferax sp.]MDD2919508.1 selenoneine biosynthesis selenosugar synthase SenB [Rhodoferax sp.]